VLAGGAAAEDVAQVLADPLNLGLVRRADYFRLAELGLGGELVELGLQFGDAAAADRLF
jgi:hypothetical protein